MGRKIFVKDFNTPAVVRQSSNRWEGNAAYDTTTKTEASQSLVESKINPNGPTGLVPQKVDQ